MALEEVRTLESSGLEDTAEKADDGNIISQIFYQLLIQHINIEFNVSKISLSIHLVTPHHTYLRITNIVDNKILFYYLRSTFIGFYDVKIQ